MKVAFVLKYFLPQVTGGTEVYAAALCQELIKMKVEVLIIKPSNSIKDFNEYDYEDIRVLEYAETDVVDKELLTGKRTPEGLPFFTNLLLK
ncbi:MAG TPA: hypothetical protein VF610_06485, partial [Segetibacter sp.]